MTNFFKALVVIAVLAIAGTAFLALQSTTDSIGTSYDATTITNPFTFESTVAVEGAITLATTTTENLTSGGQACTLTDANGGTYTLTNAQVAQCSYLTFAAGGAGQAVIALTLPATSTMTTAIPNAGDCKNIIYSARSLSAATTTTITAGTGHNILAYTTSDDVIDGLERAQLTLCRLSNGDVDTFTTEILNAD